MRKFDTKVQHLKYKVLREVARQAWNDTLLDNILEIPKKIVPGKIRACCLVLSGRNSDAATPNCVSPLLLYKCFHKQRSTFSVPSH